MKKSFSSYVKDYLMLAVLVALIILFSILGPAMANRAFFNFSNLLTMLNQNAYLVILGVGMSIGLFFLLPTLLGTAVTLFTHSMLVRNVAESLLKIVIFVGYLVLCSRMKDIHRVFQYHGAEHKTIFCYEAGLPLTVENVRRQPRHHPRCGTSFLFMVIAISILVSTVVFAIWPVHNPILRFLAHLAMLPLIVFSLLFGFAVNLNGGKNTPVGQFLDDLSNVMMRFVKIITYYAPIAFFGFFAAMVASYGAQITASYARAMLAYYPLCFVYALLAFPLLAYLGGGRKGVRRLRRHILRPAVTALGTCSSVATIPANMEAAEGSGIPHEVADLVLPLGATMHMDGSCFSCVLKVAFLFGVFGLPFEGAGLFAEVLAVAVFSSVAMSGIPGGGYIAEFILCSLFFPDRMAVAYPIAVTIGNLVDPPATMVNAAGDYAASFLVARITEGSGWLERTDGERAA